jgi:hypothetical protein
MENSLRCFPKLSCTNLRQKSTLCIVFRPIVSHPVFFRLLVSYNPRWSGAEKPMQEPTSMRRLMLFVRTFRKARKLGFGLIDAMRAARVNSSV